MKQSPTLAYEGSCQVPRAKGRPNTHPGRGPTPPIQFRRCGAGAPCSWGEGSPAGPGCAWTPFTMTGRWTDKQDSEHCLPAPGSRTRWLRTSRSGWAEPSCQAQAIQPLREASIPPPGQEAPSTAAPHSPSHCLASLWGVPTDSLPRPESAPCPPAAYLSLTWEVPGHPGSLARSLPTPP